MRRLGERHDWNVPAAGTKLDISSRSQLPQVPATLIQAGGGREPPDCLMPMPIQPAATWVSPTGDALQ
jgi:hypothetical protein